MCAGAERNIKSVVENKIKLKKVVISANASQTGTIEKWMRYWKHEGCEIINYPIRIKEENFLDVWPKVHKDFYKSLSECNIHFIANEDKNETVGYIGVGVFAELSFSLGLNFSRDKKIVVFINKTPDPKSIFYEDIIRWINLGWVKLFTIADVSKTN